MINLDKMTEEELWGFHNACKEPDADWVKRGRELFPDRPIHYIKATKMLHEYAYYKAASIHFTIDDGFDDLDDLDDCEFMCKHFYKQLPKWAR